MEVYGIKNKFRRIWLLIGISIIQSEKSSESDDVIFYIRKEDVMREERSWPEKIAKKSKRKIKRERERAGNPAGPYENLASNRVLNLIKTRNPPRERPAGTCRGCEQGKLEGRRGQRGSRWLQGCHPNYLWLDKKNELKKRMRWGRGWAARDSQLIGVFKSLHWSPGPR